MGSAKPDPVLPFQVAGRHARGRAWQLTRRLLAVIAAGETLALLAWALLGRHLVFELVQLAAIGAMLLVPLRFDPKIERWLAGARGERKVARVVAELEAEGWLALHDVALGERGNVDHILLGPAGLFTIETKGHRGRLDARRMRPEWLSQAYAEAKLVERVTGLRTEPLLVFSEAWLSPAQWSARGVQILPARMLAGHLRRRPGRIPPERVAEMHRRLRTALLGVAR